MDELIMDLPNTLKTRDPIERKGGIAFRKKPPSGSLRI
jgi:hypothetical protein